MTTQLNKYVWERDEITDPASVRRLVETFDIPDAAAKFLASRSFTPESTQEYLEPGESRVHDPFLFSNMTRAVECIGRAVNNKRRVLIHGDYDVDGICGTALLYHYLRGVVPHVYRFVPDRRKDGYGIADRAVEWAVANRVGLFIAVDCGTSDDELVSRMESAGIDVVVCDHHEFPVDREVRGIVLNPSGKGEEYPFSGLCGTGVAFKLVQALESQGISGATSSKTLMDLLALATVGDMSPLVDENRYFVREGLRLLSSAKRIGVEALKKVAGIDRSEISGFHIGFILAPRLNAPGRISNPKPALELLCTDDRKHAFELASILEEDNNRRKELTEKVKDDVLKTIRAMSDREARGGFVLAGSNWNEGVLGIAAARVVDDFAKPAVLISLAGGMGKGSGRSVPGVHLKEQLDDCSHHLVRYGGHSQAVGLTIDASKIDVFVADLSRLLGVATASLPTRPVLRINTTLTLDGCSMELVDFLGRCEPFGNGNKNPVWMIERVAILPETRYVGKGHLKLHIHDDNGVDAEAISFNWGQRGTPPKSLHGLIVDLAVTVKRGYYLERHYPEIQVLDIREHGG